MFIGTFEHNMDSKNRVFVPAKFREELGESFYYKLYPSEKYPSLQLYSKDEFRKQFEEPGNGISNLAKKSSTGAFTPSTVTVLSSFTCIL